MVEENEYKTSRDRVLQTLLAREKCTINELAEAVELNPISIRHHIVKLEAEGLVKSEEERHGVGRPRRTYSLSEKGHEQFPTRYIQLTLRLLEQLKENATSAFIHKLFTQMAEAMASSYQHEVQNLSIEKRLIIVHRLLALEGFPR